MTTGERWVLAALVALLALPVVTVLVRFHGWTWYPTLDVAMTELRMRDVGTVHTPLVGLPGRMGTLRRQGSHPGPLSFYLLAPVYRVLGSSTWGLQVACASLHVLAIAAALAVAARTGGILVMVAVAAAISVLTAGYGFVVLTEPWNPLLPTLPWLLFLLAMWAVWCGDVAMLPLVILAGSFCAQTHVPYLPLTVALGAASTAVALRQWSHARPEVGERRRVAWWIVASLSLGAVLWMPPTLEQVIDDPGNYRILFEHFFGGDGPVTGWARGVALIVERVDLYHLIVDQLRAPGSLVKAVTGPVPSAARGAACLGAWLLAWLVAFRLGSRALLRLHAVVAASLVVGVAVASRIPGPVWYYLLLWMWGVATVLLLAVTWTIAIVVSRWIGHRHRHAWRSGALGGLVVALIFTIRLTSVVPSAVQSGSAGSEIGPLADAVGTALEGGADRPDARPRRYLVWWSDALRMGSAGFALMSELERRGFDVGVPEPYETLARPHRVIDAAVATAAIVFANGAFVGKYRAMPEGQEIASIDPRSPEQRREFDELRNGLVGDLRAAGLPPAVVDDVDENLLGVAFNPEAAKLGRGRIERMLQLGTASAVFLFPPDFRLPP